MELLVRCFLVSLFVTLRAPTGRQSLHLQSNQKIHNTPTFQNKFTTFQNMSTPHPHTPTKKNRNHTTKNITSKYPTQKKLQFPYRFPSRIKLQDYHPRVDLGAHSPKPPRSAIKIGVKDSHNWLCLGEDCTYSKHMYPSLKYVLLEKNSTKNMFHMSFRVCLVFRVISYTFEPPPDFLNTFIYIYIYNRVYTYHQILCNYTLVLP